MCTNWCRRGVVRLLVAIACGTAIAIPSAVEAAPVRIGVLGSFWNGANDLFDSGDVEGTLSPVAAAAFNATAPADLRAAYDVLLFAYGDGNVLDNDWTTRMLPYLALGGGVLFEDPHNVDDLAPGLSALRESGCCAVDVTATVPLLTDGIEGSPGGFDPYYMHFTGWAAMLSPFLGDQGRVVGLYGEAPGGGRMVVTGTLQSYYADREGVGSDRNQYELLRNEVRWVARLCESGSDGDGDGRVDTCDNCPAVANADQGDGDDDGVGDACDPCAGDPNVSDSDGDGRCSDPVACPAGCDNCPFSANPGQGDGDGDGIGDACDRCPTASDPGQEDTDQDGLGDACDDCLNLCSYPGPCARSCYDPLSGDCTVEPAAEGAVCDDFSICTDNDRCQAGTCAGTPVVCPPASDPCAESVCNSFAGCLEAPREHGAPCDDGDGCTTADSCSLGVCSGSEMPACRQDQYKCWRTSGAEADRATVSVSDRFGVNEHVLGRTRNACNAASDGAALQEPGTHLSCRVIETSGTPFSPRTVEMRDRFGTATLRMVRALSHCAPSFEGGAVGPTGVDEMTCYRVAGGASTDRVVELVDQFETRTTRVLKPYAVCSPATRDGSAAKDPDRHLTCYKIRGASGSLRATHEITLTSALGTETLHTRHGRHLCVPSTVRPCASVTFETNERGYTGSLFCGGPVFDPPPAPPYVGALYDGATGGMHLNYLSAGCIYFGGGASTFYPAAEAPVGASYVLEAQDCTGIDLQLSATPESVGEDCAVGPAAFEICVNDPKVRCAEDADCGGRAGSCQHAPRCFAGPPQVFRSVINGFSIDVCLISPLAGDVTATVTPSSGDMSLQTPSRTLVYLTFNGCPQCLSGACVGGPRNGLPCTVSASSDQTSLDCPPDFSSYFASFGPGTSALSNDPVAMSSATGLFCPGQVNPGAFGEPSVRRIELSGFAAGDLTDGDPHSLALLDLQCVAATGNAAVDSLSDFPGPRALTIAGTVTLQR